MNSRTWEIVEKTSPFRGYFRIDRYVVRHALFAGGMSGKIVREVFERGHAAAVLPYDPVRDEVVLIEQFRIGALAAGRDPWLLEIVAGIVEPGETPKSVVRREMAEEAGLTFTAIEPIADVLLSPGGTSETMACFCARVDSREAGGIHGRDDEDEDIRVVPMAADDAIAAVNALTISNAPAVIALLWLAVHRERLKAAWTA